MSQGSEPKKIYTLSQLGESLKRTLEQVTHGRTMWFKAEIAKLSKSPEWTRLPGTGGRSRGQRLAMMKGTIWKTQHAAIRKELGEAADQVLAKGTEIVFTGQVNYHAVYGVSLVIQEIDLSAMVGEAERRKQETLNTLKAEGALERNKALPLPSLIQRIALVGSPGTSGFRDFGVHLLRNDWGLGFDVEVFPASVQGKEAPAALIQALLQAQTAQPDVIVVVRGGGSALDLDAFNDLGLCRAILKHAPARPHGHRPRNRPERGRPRGAPALQNAHRRGGLPRGPRVERALQTRRVEPCNGTASATALGLRAGAMCSGPSNPEALQPQQLLAAEGVKLSHAREQLASRAQQALERQLQRMGHLASTVDALSPKTPRTRLCHCPKRRASRPGRARPSSRRCADPHLQQRRGGSRRDPCKFAFR